jgi:hypothetical protein
LKGIPFQNPEKDNRSMVSFMTKSFRDVSAKRGSIQKKKSFNLSKGKKCFTKGVDPIPES